MMKDLAKYRKEAHPPACIYDLLKILQSFLMIKTRYLLLALGLDKEVENEEVGAAKYHPPVWHFGEKEGI